MDCFDEEKWESDWPDWESKLQEWKSQQEHLIKTNCEGKPDETFFWDGCLACTCVNEQKRCNRASECTSD